MKILLLWTVLLRLVAADLSCLTIAWWSPIAGAVCYFAPKVFNGTEEAVVQAVNHTIAQAENAVDFSIHYNPITLTYNFVDTASREGIAAANTQLGQEIRNISQATIGFGKETISQALTIVQLASFGQIVECFVAQEAQAGISAGYNALMNSTQPTANETTVQNYDPKQVASSVATSRKRAVQPLSDQAVAIGRKCIADHFAKPLWLNPSNELQQQGADISDVAGLLLPFAEGEAVAAGAVKDGVELALPGLEETTSILKLEEGAESGARFASVEEAEQVQANLGKKGWQGENCKVCTTPGLSKRLSIRSSRGLVPRGAAFSMCCPIGKGGSSTVGDAEMTALNSDAEGLGEIDGPVTEEPAVTGSTGLPEGVTADPAGTNPNFPQLEVITSVPVRSFEDGIPTLIKDLSKQRTGTLGYSSAAQAIYDSEGVLKEVADIVNSEDASLRDILEFKENGATNRWASENGNKWLQSTDPRLSKLQQWCKQVTEDLSSAGDKILAADTANADLIPKYKWEPRFNLYYTKPGTKINRVTDGGVLGFHYDRPYLSYSTSNVAGLTVDVAAQGAAEVKLLTPVVDNAFYLLKGTQQGGVTAATRHAVGAAEAVQNGRAAIVVEMARAYKG